MESNIQIHAQFDRTKEGREKRTVSRTRAAPGAGLRSPHQGAQLSRGGCWRVKPLICDSLNGVRIMRAIHAMDLHTPEKDSSPWEWIAARSWSIGIRGQSQDKDPCGLQGGGPRDGRKETVAGSAFEGKVHSHEGRVLLLSHVQAVVPSLLPFSPHI